MLVSPTSISPVAKHDEPKVSAAAPEAALILALITYARAVNAIAPLVVLVAAAMVMVPAPLQSESAVSVSVPVPVTLKPTFTFTLSLACTSKGQATVLAPPLNVTALLLVLLANRLRL